MSASVTGYFHTNWVNYPELYFVEVRGSVVTMIFTQDEELSPAPAADQFTVNVLYGNDAPSSTIAVDRVIVRGDEVDLELVSDPPFSTHDLETGRQLTLDYIHWDATPLKSAAQGGDSVPNFAGRLGFAQ